MIEPDPAEAAWIEQREADKVESAISLIRVYQYKMPDGIGPYYHHRAPWPRDWWEAFWEKLEHAVEERECFIRLWEERDLPGGRQAELTGYLEMDPALCPYKRHGQQGLDDYDGGASA